MRATNVNVSAKGRGSARPRQTTLLRSRLQNNGRPSSTRGRLVFAKAEENKDNGGEGKNALLEAFEQYKGEKKGESSGGMKLPKVDLKTPSFELTKNVWKKVDTEWSVARKSLADFGLESVSSYNASNMVKDGKAVIVDVRTKQAYEIEHVEPSMSLPLYVRAKGGEGSFAKKVFLGSKTTRKNEDFAADAKALLGDEQRTIIVACSTGGDLANNSNGNGSGNEFGRDSLSLRACNELIGAGYTNVRHLGGGIAAWTAEGLAVAGSKVEKEAEERRKAEAETRRVEEAETEKRQKVFGIAMNDNSYKVWPLVHSFLTQDKKMKSISGEDAWALIQGDKAVVIDVSLTKDYSRTRIEPSLNVPLYRNMTGNKSLGNIKNFLTGYYDTPKERNPDFVAEAKKALQEANSEGKTVIVTCAKGGTLKTESFDKKGNAYSDPQFKHGIESNSLNAVYELLSAGGLTDVVHLEGGNSGWSFAKLPMFQKRPKYGAAFPAANDTSNFTYTKKDAPEVSPNSIKGRPSKKKDTTEAGPEAGPEAEKKPAKAKKVEPEAKKEEEPEKAAE
jgi:rhodanese-related sulfurtransferase